MEQFASVAGLAGAACCVGMYAAVSLGRVSAERPQFYAVNGIGAVLVMAGAWHSFDIGDLGTIAQELTWAMVSALGIVRALAKARGA